MSKVQWPGGFTGKLARFVIRSVARFVPSGRRDEWRQTWEADLWDLASDDASRHPSVLTFAAGSLPAAVREVRAEWGPAAMAADLARAWRRLRGRPLHVAFAVSMMVVGIGANTSIFAIVSATLIRVPPHVSDAGSLVQIGRIQEGADFDNFSYPNYIDIRDQNRVFAGVAAYGRFTPLVRTSSGTVPLPVHAVTANFFDVLGSPPAAGRAFTESDETSRARVVVVSDALWRRHLGGTRDAIGRTLALEGVPFTIVGVAAPGFVGADVAGAAPQAWIPLLSYDAALAVRPHSAERGHSWLWVIARLAPGVSFDRARGEMHVLHSRLVREHAATLGAGIGVVRGVGLKPDDRAEAERVSALLMAIVAAVLLIACANLAGLLVAQAAERRRDFTICAALGASSMRLTRELLAEHLLISLAGAIGAWTLTCWTARAVQSILPYTLAISITPDWRVFLFAVTAAVATSLAFGALPAMRTARVDVVSGLREAGQGGARLGSASTWMAAAQIALCFALLIGAGLLVRSVAQARFADPGFDVDSVAAVQMNLELVRRRSGDEAARMVERLREAAGRMPGVERSALASHPPLAVPQQTYSLRGPGTEITERPATAAVNAISPGYLAALNIRLLNGRDFSSREASPGSARTLLVSETTARKMWPGRNPIGQRLEVNDDAEVIGVVSDVKLRSLSDRNLAAVYVPLGTEPPSEVTLLVRTTFDPARAAAQISQMVRASTPDVVITAAGPLRDLMGRTYGEMRLVATLLTVFSGIAALLAAAGLYVVLASWVIQRRTELAMRVALGATPRDLRLVVFQRAAVPTLAGLLAGGGLALAATRSLEAMLFGVGRLDPVAYVAAAALLLAVTVAAAYVPARRAMRTDPLVTLKGS